MYITLNNHNIFYQKMGRGKNLVLLHGWGHDSSDFWPLIESLKNDFTLWLIDLPGFGRSDIPKKPFSVSDYANIIKKFIEDNKISGAIILGHSVGGRVAIKLSANNPKLLDKLILENSAGLLPKQDLLKLFVYPIAKIFRYLLPNFFGIKTRIRYLFYKKMESDYLTAGPLKETLTNLIYEDLTNDLKKITTETLLIWGEKDPTSEASLRNGKRMYQLIPSSRIEVLEDVGHFPHLENPEKFISLIKDFIL